MVASESFSILHHSTSISLRWVLLQEKGYPVSVYLLSVSASHWCQVTREPSTSANSVAMYPGRHSMPELLRFHCFIKVFCIIRD